MVMVGASMEVPTVSQAYTLVSPARLLSNHIFIISLTPLYLKAPEADDMNVTVTTDQMLATALLMLRPLASVHTMAPCHGDHWHWSSVTARADPTLLPHTEHREPHC